MGKLEKVHSVYRREKEKKNPVRTWNLKLKKVKSLR
jgi:hypothetical protein